VRTIGARQDAAEKACAFHSGVRFFGAEEDDAVTDACPDPKTPVVFEVRREFED
jgi:uncharacterized repeat protein (TIGR04076 family)